MTLTSQPEKDLTLGDLVVVLRRRRRIIYGFVAAVGLLAIIYCLFATRRYQSIGLIEVQSKNRDQLGLDTIAGAAASGEADALVLNFNLQTQANILQSDSLALKTIEDLGLEKTSDYQPHFNPISWILGLFSPNGTPDKAGASLEDSPRRRRHVLTVFARMYKVKPVSGTRLIEIQYLSSNPQTAAAVINDVIANLANYNDQTRRGANQQVVTALTSQLETLRKRSVDLNQQLADLETRYGVLNTGTLEPTGIPGAYSSVIEQLKVASAQLAEAQQDRILRQAIAEAAEKGDSETLSSLAGNSVAGAAMNNSLGLIQTLRAQEATSQSALAQAESKFGPSYSKLEELRANLAETRHSIQQEVSRLRQRAVNDYRIASKTEKETRVEYNHLRAKAERFNNKSFDLTPLRLEADAASKLYEDMQTKLQQAGVLQGLKDSAISVVDPGRVQGKPAKPNVPLYLAIALVAGLILGVIAALAADVLDARLHALRDAEVIAPGGLIGVTPELNDKVAADGAALVAIDDPACPFAGSLRALRSTVLLMKSSVGLGKVIQVTSGVSGEGKTTIAANLAVLLAQSGKKVLLVDADIRSGNLRSLFDVKEAAGLSELLSGQTQAPAIIQTKIPGLEVLIAGARTEAAELLGSEIARRWINTWRQDHDYIVFDCGSLLPQADSLALAPLSDLVIQVVRSNVSEKNQITRTQTTLAGNTSQPVAVLFNGLQSVEEGYSSYFGRR